MIECPSCEHVGDCCYRCQNCGKDLVDESSTTVAEQEVHR